MTENFQLFDALPAHIEDALRASIERFGVLVPVSVDQNGRILDGHHRKRIAEQLKVPYDRLVRHCADDDERREIAHTLNSDRRQLTEAQRSEVALELRKQGHSFRAIGGALGVSHVQAMKDVESASGGNDLPPERVKGMDGKSYQSRRPQVMARDEREQERAQDALDLIGDEAPPGTLNVREARIMAARNREPEPVPEPIAPPVGQYRCFVIDPPWPMQKIEREERPDQGLALEYPTMPIYCQDPAYEMVDDYIKEPPPCFEAAFTWDNEYDEGWKPCQSIQCVIGEAINRAALDDCHIYLWVTHKYLPDGLELLQSWGFNYQCVMTWRKNVGITPFSWMYDTEHVLFGRRGNLSLERMGLRLSFEAPVIGHSVKPDVFYERVLEATPGPRVEMFARTNRDGFTAWGNEVVEDDVI